MAGSELKYVVEFSQSYANYSLTDKVKEFDRLKMKVPLILRLNCVFSSDAVPGVDLVFLIDTSGSMGEPKSAGEGWPGENGEPLTRIQAVSESLQLLSAQLRPDDRAAVVTFSTEPTTLFPLTDKEAFKSKVRELPDAGGATDIALALRAARDLLAARTETRPAVIVLLTDGYAEKAPANWKDPKVPDADKFAARDKIRVEYKQRALVAADELADAGYELVTLGFGDDYDEQLLIDLNARVTQNEAWYVDSREKAERSLFRALKEQQAAVLENVRLEGVFNTEHFSWVGLWQVLPKASRMSIPRTDKLVSITTPPAQVVGGSVTGRAATWNYMLGNVKVDRYALLIAVEPKSNMPAGTVPVAQFKMTWKGNDQYPPKTLTLEVVPGAVKRAAASVPHNPDLDVTYDWLIAQTADLRVRRDEQATFGRHTEAIELGEKLCEFHEKAKNVGPERQDDEEWLVRYRSEKNLPGPEKKRAAERLSQAGTMNNTKSHDKAIEQSTPMVVDPKTGKHSPGRNSAGFFSGLKKAIEKGKQHEDHRPPTTASQRLEAQDPKPKPKPRPGTN